MPTSLKDFEAVFPRLVEDLKEHCKTYKLPDQALKWFEEVHLSRQPQPRLHPVDLSNSQLLHRI